MPRFPHAPRQPASQHASVPQCPGMARALAATLLLVKAHHYCYQISTLSLFATEIVLIKVFLLIASPSVAKKRKRQKGKV